MAKNGRAGGGQSGSKWSSGIDVNIPRRRHRTYETRFDRPSMVSKSSQQTAYIKLSDLLSNTGIAYIDLCAEKGRCMRPLRGHRSLKQAIHITTNETRSPPPSPSDSIMKAFHPSHITPRSSEPHTCVLSGYSGLSKARATNADPGGVQHTTTSTTKGNKNRDQSR